MTKPPAEQLGEAGLPTYLLTKQHCRATRRRLDAVQSGYSTLSIVKQGDLMVVANVGDSRVVLGTTFDEDAITSSSSSST
uniref:protein-serine/threonine phosphatase n=1 Tax=Zea mays TaxID=4577 RepID=A0A804PG30_MAIZE